MYISHSRRSGSALFILRLFDLPVLTSSIARDGRHRAHYPMCCSVPNTPHTHRSLVGVFRTAANSRRSSSGPTPHR